MRSFSVNVFVFSALVVGVMAQMANFSSDSGPSFQRRQPRGRPTTSTTTTTPPPTTTEDPRMQPNMKNFENFLKNVTNTAVKQLLPSMLEITQKVTISSKCMSSLLKYIAALKKIRVWAVRMFDATAKFPVGFFDGTLIDFGAFAQCLKIVVNNRKGAEEFRGKYCSIDALPPLREKPRNLSMSVMPDAKFDESIMEDVYSRVHVFYHMTMRFGICVPSTCEAEDMRRLITEAVSPLKYSIKVPSCHVKENIIVEPVHIAVLSVVGVILLVIGAGTVLEWHQKKKKEALGSTGNPGVLYHIVTSFSISSNFRKLVTTKTSSEEMKSLHGIRALSMTWVILGHTYIWMDFQMLSRSIAASEWFNQLSFGVILNGWLAVIPFMFLTGLLTTYTTLKYMETSNGKLNIFFYVIRRFLRLFPPLLLVLGSVFFLPWITTGPFWQDLPGQEVDNCYAYWWTNLLFINNWRPVNQLCLQHTWYVSADLQLHIIALLVIIPLYWKPFVGFLAGLLLTIAGTIAVGVITYVNDLDPAILISTGNLENIYKVAQDIHIKTFTYFGPYCVGMVTGYLVLKFRKVKLSAMTQLLGWCAAAAISVSSLYGTHQWNIGNFHGPLVTSIYAALHRTTFVVGLGWVAFVCLTGHGGPVAAILSSKPLILISRLTYMGYLVQGPIIWVRYGSIKDRIYLTHYNMFYEYVCNIFLTLVFAFAGNLLVETPFANLERLLFSGIGKKREQKVSLPKVELKEERNVEKGSYRQTVSGLEYM